MSLQWTDLKGVGDEEISKNSFENFLFYNLMCNMFENKILKVCSRVTKFSLIFSPIRNGFYMYMYGNQQWCSHFR